MRDDSDYLGFSHLRVCPMRPIKLREKAAAFIMGAREFRLSFTTDCGVLDEYYAWGRELAHRLTLRRFEP
jgi:hypothetical protein